MLPARKKPARSGIERAPRREWPKHEQGVRGHRCCVEDAECSGPIRFAHVRDGTDGGEGLKPSSWWGISLCDGHHTRQHNIGEPAFERRYGIRMKRLAMEFAVVSKDIGMKEAWREARILTPHMFKDL